MANRIIRGYWDCPQCGTKGIEGLADVCPNCGSGKDKNVRYYMKEAEEVSGEELEKAGIGKEEGDGKHKEWVCAYCGSLNNFRDQVCVRCGADREEKAQDYGGDTSGVRYERDSRGNLRQTAKKEEIPKQTYQTKEELEEKERREKGRKGSPLPIILLAAAAIILAVILWPRTEARAITGFAWERAVTVEELQTFSESGWSLPEGARQTGAKRELYGYDQVLDHYETDYETRTRQVVDHYDVSHTYTDNGNGTFTEHEVRTPVYRTETYREEVRRPVYRSVPRYETKYYYDIDRWVALDTYETAGEDHDPYWSGDYTLSGNQRDTDRSETYYTIYNETIKRKTDYDRWAGEEVGDGVYVTRNLLGMEYGTKERG